ncbi:MAG: ABC transporter permease [Dehalogenimonas sp.]
MKLFKLALKNITGSGFRSVAIFLCVMGIAGFLLSTTLIIRGSQYSLTSAIERLGADIIVVPQGAEDKVESALLMGKPTNVWMPEENLAKIAAIPGVEVVSPQIYLGSMFDASCCAVPEMFMVAFDPKTDFTITPWLIKNLGRELGKGESIGGTYVFVPEGDTGIKLYGYYLTLDGNLEPTGTGIDQTMFLTIETAEAMAASSITTAEEQLSIPADSISTIMVKVAPGVNAHEVALDILSKTTGMYPIESPNLFGAFRNQMNGLLWGFFALSVVIWIISAMLMAVNFSMAANERKREMAVLRAVGASPGFIFRLVLTEAGILAVTGAVLGITFASIAFFLFKDAIAASLKMPFLFPSISSFAALFGVGVGLALATVALAALVPAIRVSKQELAIAMRE